MSQEIFNYLNLGEAEQKSLSVAEKVMLGLGLNSVPSFSQLRGIRLTDPIEDILLELYHANSARSVYEAAIELPLDDLYYVGGQLQTLIRRAEKTKTAYGHLLAFHHLYALSCRIEEAKSFRKYIIERIKRGA